MSGFRLRVVVAFAVSLFFAWPHVGVASQPDPKARAQEFVEQLNTGAYDQAVNAFDATMRGAMSAKKLQEAWQSLSPKAGSFKEIVGVALVKKGKYDIAAVTCRFEKGQLDVRVVYDSEGKVSGLWFSPAAPPVSPPPPYADPKSFSEEQVTVGSGWWALPGTLTRPKGEGPFPAVVLVHGSGPNDRDETIGPNKPFRDLAWGLATRGVAVLRYEKRTKHHPLKMVLLANSLTVEEETIDDALVAVNTLRSIEKIDAKRIYVLGHSLGGMLVPRIARGDENVAGFVIFAGASRPLEDIYLEQMEYIFSLKGEVSEKDQERLETIREQVVRVKSPGLSKDISASELPLGVPPAYWLDLRGYEPAKEAARMERPLLVMQAGRDYQVIMDDFAIWKAALADRSNVQFRLYPKCNHLFIEGEGPCTPAEYAQSGHVTKSVIDDIAQWICQPD